jgi:hypothetical protein
MVVAKKRDCGAGRAGRSVVEYGTNVKQGYGAGFA